MLRITYGLSFLCFSILWLSLCAPSRELDDTEICGAVCERNDLQLRSRQTERFQQEGIRYGKFEERGTFIGAIWFIGNENNSFNEATRMIQSDIEPLKDFRMRSRDFRNDDLKTGLDARSRVRSRDSEEMSLSRVVSSSDERLSSKRVNEERRTDRVRMREVSLRRSQERRNFEPQRIRSQNRDSSRVHERTRSREIDSSSRSRVRARRNMPGWRRSAAERSTHDAVSGFLELCYVKMKENLTTILLSIIFLLDFVNELVRGKKNANSMWGKSLLDTTGLTKIFC